RQRPGPCSAHVGRDRRCCPCTDDTTPGTVHVVLSGELRQVGGKRRPVPGRRPEVVSEEEERGERRATCRAGRLHGGPCAARRARPALPSAPLPWRGRFSPPSPCRSPFEAPT